MSRTATHVIYSELPLPPEDVNEIVSAFQVELDKRVALMYDFCRNGEWEQLAGTAHWLKGAGGTVGFNQFVQPSMHLEELAKTDQVVQSIADAILEIIKIKDSIRVREPKPLPTKSIAIKPHSNAAK